MLGSSGGLTPPCDAAAADPATTEPAAQPLKPRPSTKCPVSGEHIDPKVTYVYNGNTYGFCFADCINKFNKNPQKYTAAAK